MAAAMAKGAMKVMAGIGGGVGNGTAGLIAKGAEKMMTMAKVKVAAVVMVRMERKS